MITAECWRELALNFASALGQTAPLEAMLDALRPWVPCDAAAWLHFQEGALVPLAIRGLSRETLGRRFNPEHHPRLAQLCQSESGWVFEPGCSLPDPYDGLVLNQEGSLPVHACMGLALRNPQGLLGLVTFDSLTAGAFDSLTKGQIESLSEFCSRYFELVLAQKQRQAAPQMPLAYGYAPTQEEIIGQSAAIQRLKADITTVAASPFTVLISGETGTGKELVAKSLHRQSDRAHAPLVQVNCAALPEHLIESELFGHVKGAFTGAVAHRSGKFLLAHQGTLFLDEIGELPLAAQGKLLRVLQSGELQPVGQDQPQQVDVRLIAATNRDLQHEVAAGRFRADLYHRLSVYPIHLPPLRAREQDVELLAGFFIERLARKLGISQLCLAPQTLMLMQHYDWPGNVRELKHLISRGALRAKQRPHATPWAQLEPEDCGLGENNSHKPSKVNTANFSPAIQQDLKQATEAFQRQLIEQSWIQHQANGSATARALNMDRANLFRLAKRLGLSLTKPITNKTNY